MKINYIKKTYKIEKRFIQIDSLYAYIPIKFFRSILYKIVNYDYLNFAIYLKKKG